MRPFTQRLVTAVFLLLLVLPSLSILMPVQVSEIENRRLTRPEFSSERLFDLTYYRDLRVYVRDANPVRAWMIAVAVAIDFRLFRDSPNPAEALLGQDGWIFSRDSFESLCNDEALTAARNLVSLVTELEAGGADVVYTIVPSKYVIEDEYLTETQRRFGLCGFDTSEMLRSYMAENANSGYVDSWSLLEEVQASGVEPYFKTDTHLQYRGLVPWMHAIINELDDDLWLPEDVVDLGPVEFEGNLGVILGQGLTERVEKLEVDRGLSTVPIEQRHARLTPSLWSTERFVADSSDQKLIEGRTVFLKDSHGDLPTPSLVQFFADITIHDFRGEQSVEEFVSTANGADTVLIVESDTGMLSTFVNGDLLDRIRAAR